MSQKIIFTIFMILIVVSLVAAVPAVSAESAPAIQQDEQENPLHVKVPIIFNGVLYQPDEFNKIQDEIYASGGSVGMIVTGQEDHPVAYDSIESYDRYAKAYGLPKMAEMLKAARAAEACSKTEDTKGLRTDYLELQGYYHDAYPFFPIYNPDLGAWNNHAWYAMSHGVYAGCWRNKDYTPAFPLTIGYDENVDLDAIGWAHDIESCMVID